MEIVLVGAPGSGTRPLGRYLSERHRARFVDLTGDPRRHLDAISDPRLAAEPERDPVIRRIVAADRIIADTAVRAGLYRGRKVIWLDVPADQLVERLRAGRRSDVEIKGDYRSFTVEHLRLQRPFYEAGTRVDGSGSINRTAALVEAALDADAVHGTLILRADLHDGMIELGEGILPASLAHVLKRRSVQRLVVVTSARARARADEAVVMVTEATDVHAGIEELPDGESAKTLAHQETLFRRLASRHLQRDDPIVAIGDDTLLEAATFAAGVWLRGVPLVTVPVTTLGLIDTAIGGKGGVDLPDVGRNLLGTIKQPTATILDVDLAADETPGERWAALAEVVKYGLIGDPRLLALLETLRRDGDDRLLPTGTTLLEMVERCALAKRRFVISDERDREDVRIALNLGHTTSHALEAATDYTLGHGEAVGYGLRVALAIGRAIGVTPDAIAARATRILDQLRLGVPRLDIPADRILDFVESDKKRIRGRMRWVLVASDGIVVRDDIPAEMVRKAIATVTSG